MNKIFFFKLFLLLFFFLHSFIIYIRSIFKIQLVLFLLYYLIVFKYNVLLFILILIINCNTIFFYKIFVK